MNSEHKKTRTNFLIRNRGIGRPTTEDTRNAHVKNDAGINFNSSIVVESVQFSVTEEKPMRFYMLCAGAFSVVAARRKKSKSFLFYHRHHIFEFSYANIDKFYSCAKNRARLFVVGQSFFSIKKSQSSFFSKKREEIGF